MLTESEQRLIADRLGSCDHDYFSLSGVAGEPFLRSGLICYFDGHSVEICGVPLESGESDRELERRVQRVIDEWACDPYVSYINYCGPVPIDMPRSGSFACQYTEDPVPWNLDVFIDLTAPVLTNRKIRGNVRRAQQRGIEVAVGRREYLSAEHVRLLTRLITGADMMLEDVCTISNVATILRDPATFSVEARQDGKLVGFAIGHRYFASTPILVCSAFDSCARGCSDAVYAAMLTHCRELGATRMGLGYTTDEGLFQYKTKWGKAILGRPFFQRIWGSGPEVECLYWPWRFFRATWRTYESE